MFKFLLVLLILANRGQAAEPTPDEGTWEAWLLRMRASQSWAPVRPDKKEISEPLPLWVDCHLSWMLDHPRLGRELHVPKGLILHASAKLCKGQIEEWAH